MSRIQDFENIRRTARGLVLTEWKIVTSASNLAKKAEEAREQTNLYNSGVLGGMELKGTRYIVLVSKEDFAPLKDIAQDSVTFRHIIIPVKPNNPSVAARKKRN
jgi:parvulin-like peptidyl-prolyl isomerase